MLRISVAIFLIISAPLAAQQTITTANVANGAEFEGMRNLGAINYAWEEQYVDADLETVRDTLEASGYTVDDTASWVSASDRFRLYSSTSAPGAVGYLVIPEAENAAPVTYAPANLMTASFFDGPLTAAGISASDIRNKILEGMKTSIKAICQIGAQPESITGRASAVGVIEIEATWKGADICRAIE